MEVRTSEAVARDTEDADGLVIACHNSGYLDVYSLENRELRTRSLFLQSTIAPLSVVIFPTCRQDRKDASLVLARIPSSSQRRLDGFLLYCMVLSGDAKDHYNSS